MTILRDVSNDVFVSVASVWEIAIKRATGKLQFPAPIVEAVHRMGFELLPINAPLTPSMPAHCRSIITIPSSPADHCPSDARRIGAWYARSRFFGRYGVPTLEAQRH